MSDGEFPFRSFTMRSEGYDSNEVDSYVEELRSEILEVRRALETATPSGDGAADSRLHDPEGAVTRTLAIAQETADRVLHDSQVEADRRRAEADEHATSVIAEADERAARLLGEMEAQAAEVREQGVAAARSAIQVERDKAMAELAHVRRVRDDLRSEAVALKTSLDTYRSQAREASDTLAAASSGPLMGLDLPDFIDDDVLLAGITPVDGSSDDGADGASHLRAVDDGADDAGDSAGSPATAMPQYDYSEDELAPVIALDGDDAEGADNGGTFLAEVRAAAEDDVALVPEDELSPIDLSASGDDDATGESDRFLSELRGITTDDEDLDSEAADAFFDNQD